MDELKKRILFVDDRTKRLQWAIENYVTFFELSICACVPEALRLMSEIDFDIISLDHDLNGHDFQDPFDKTSGMEIIRYILKTGWPVDKKRPVFWIHSSNSFASHLMIVELSDGGYDVCKKPIEYDHSGEKI
jgi:hypothetical protein